jgi:hypothetical protein
VWTGVETQDVAVLKLRKSGGAPSRMVVVRFRCIDFISALNLKLKCRPAALLQ